MPIKAYSRAHFLHGVARDGQLSDGMFFAFDRRMVNSSTLRAARVFLREEGLDTSAGQRDGAPVQR